MTLTAAGFYRLSKKIRAAITKRDHRVDQAFDKYKNVGLIDTVRMVLPSRGVKTELQQIVDNTERWQTSRYKTNDGPRHKITIDRESGLTIKLRERCIIVEGSVPRIMGLSSNEVLSGVTLKSAKGVIRSMTSDLLPITTSVAEENGGYWRCTRLDCATGFFAPLDFLETMKSLEGMKWKRTHDTTRKYKNDRSSTRGIMWGRTYKRHPTARMSLYNKATEILNRTNELKSARVRPGKLLPIANRWRIESQAHGFQTLDRVCKLFKPGNDLFIGLDTKRRGIKLDYSAMHTLVFLSILELSPLANSDTRSHEAHRRLLELAYPDIWDALLQCMS